MEAIIAAEIDAEERAADAEVEDAVPTVAEWEVLAEEAAADAGEADGGEEASLQPVINVITVRYGVRDRTWTKDALWDLYGRLNIQQQVSKSVGKRTLFDVIRDSPQTTKINDDEFTYEWEESAEKQQNTSGPRWKILQGVEIELPPDFHASGAEEGYFAPTNQDNAVGHPKKKFLTDEPITRPTFRSKPRQRTNNTGVGRPPSNATPNVKGGPSDNIYKNLPDDFMQRRPIDYFHLFITKDFIEKQVLNTTNQRAAAEEAGSTTYKDFVPFDLQEIYKFIGLLYANSLSPKPRFEKWFQSTQSSKLFGNDAFASAADKRVQGGRTIKGYYRWLHFRRFLCLYDFRENPRRLQKKDPLWKVASILDELRKNCQRYWVTGLSVSIDEMTIGFKGKHGLALRITYKREGDGYQCDAVCEDGYTFSFWFRHGDAPDAPENVKHLGLSPTARRVIYLICQLPNLWTHVYMDNLFNSRKLYTAAYLNGALCQGVCRNHGRGVPLEVVQKVEADPNKANLLRGKTLAAVLEDDPSCPNLVCASVYDTKPVTMMSTICETIDWDEMQREVYDIAKKKKVTMKFLRLNLINTYNNNMGSVDLADQKRNNYRFNHWLRNRKWWWAIFLWALGVASTNAHIIYEHDYEREKAKKRKGLPKKWTHADFLTELVYDFMGWFETMNPDDNDDTDNNDESVATGTTRRGSVFTSQTTNANARGSFYDFSTDEGREEWFDFNKPDSITKQRMANGHFNKRWDGKMHPDLPTSSENAYCQYCRYRHTHLMTAVEKQHTKQMFNNRARISRCLTCKVNLCWSCKLEWHGISLEGLSQSQTRAIDG